MQDSVKQDRKKEEWKKIEGFPNYSVSNLGRVRNDKKNRIMEYSYNAKKYYRVALSKNNKRYARLVHRLVAEAFIPNPDNKPQVNHIDGNKVNNCVNNLEWATNQENQDHYWKYLDDGKRRERISVGLKRAYQNNPDLAEQKRIYMLGRTVSEETKRKLSKPIIRLEDGKIYYSTIEASKDLGKNIAPNITKVCKGKKEKAGGYHWAYYEEGKDYAKIS